MEATTLIDKYQIQELLGTGGSGSTYRALRLSDGMTVAIKMLSLRHLQDWKQLELFECEAQILAQLDHPQIPKYLEYFHVDTPTDRAFYIVQQLAPGQPLNALVQCGWRGTEAEIKSIALQLLDILQYLQSQSPPPIHRDIKPHNIVRSDDGTVFLVDFGAVQTTYNNTLMKGATVAGTYGYMAPEQFRGQAIPASDLYGLGATMLYLLTHRSPADLPQERLKVNFRSHVSISDSFADWLETMLEPDKADRFTSANQALQALTSNRYRRANSHQKSAFPWRGVAVALVAGILGLSLIHQYRYAFLSRVGLAPREICKSVARGDRLELDEYLNHGGNINITVEMIDDLSDSSNRVGTLLNCAVTTNQINIAKYLLQRGIDVKSKDAFGVPALHEIVRLPSKQALELLEIQKYQPGELDVADSNNVTALFLAVEQRKSEVVQKLLSLGADPSIKTRGKSNLLFALIDGGRDEGNPRPGPKQFPEINTILKILIQYKVNINEEVGDGKGQVKVRYSPGTPLTMAIRYHNHNMVRQLIDLGAELNALSNNGQTPLMEATELVDIETIRLLLKKGASVNGKNANGLTLLQILKNREIYSNKDKDVYPNLKNNIPIARRLIQAAQSQAR